MNAPYYLIPISLGILIVYLMGAQLVRLGIIAQALYRKVWNFILLFTFLGVAILGLLLVVQINFKLNWSFINAALKWHVDLGIAMSIVTVIHILWHLRYFSGKLKFNVKTSIQTPQSFSVLQLNVLAILLGVLSITVQVLVLRQTTKVFQGNELTMTWILGIWMILTGVGSGLGSRLSSTVNSAREFYRLISVQTLSSIAAIFLLGFVRNMIIPYGVLASPLTIIAILIVVLIPVSVPVGLLYSLLVREFLLRQKHFSSAYIFESIGSVVGGVLVSLILVNFFNIYQSILIVASVSTIVMVSINSSRVGYVIASLILTLGVISLLFPIERIIEKQLYPNQDIVEVAETPYGSLSVTRIADQYNFYENGTLLFNTNNQITAEEGAHYAMLQQEKPTAVLVVSGGFSGMLREILKYPSVKSIYYVELNNRLVSLADRYAELPADSRIKIIHEDGRRYLSRCDARFDIIILAVPEPTSLQLNRFYSDDFLNILKRRLIDGGYICMNLQPMGNYFSADRIGVVSSIVSTLKLYFPNVDVVAGERDYLLASNSPVNIRISNLVKSRGLDSLNTYVNSGYINDDNLADRSKFFWQNIGYGALNTDNNPRPVFLNSLNYLSQFGKYQYLIIIGGLLLLLVPFLFMQNSSRLMYVAGFSGASAEVILLLMFQTFFGFLYAGIGIVVALFMVGLAMGAYAVSRGVTIKSNLSILIGLYFLIIPSLWWINANVVGGLMYLIVGGLMLIPSFLVGYQYARISELEKNEVTVSKLYSADLIGSTFGVVLITLLLIPLLGINITALILAGVNFLTFSLNRKFCKLHTQGN